ncbi:MAG: methyltransferase domain-containing protein [Gemmatimonadaceae bacterium]
MTYLDEIDHTTQEFGDLYDELPLWSAPFGLLLLDRVPIRPGITVLDVGAGTGFLTIELAERCGPETTVIAVDPWTAALDRLRRKVAQRKLANVRLLEQDAAALDLPDASVDVIVSNLGVNNIDDPGSVLRACFRVAKPGATLLLTTNIAGHMAEFYDVYRAVLVELGQHDRLPVLEAHVAHRGTVGSITGMLAGAGFSVTDTVTASFRMRFASGSALLRHSFIRLGFVPGWKSVAAADALRRTFDTLERRLNALAETRGELALTVPIACMTARKQAVDEGGVGGET